MATSSKPHQDQLKEPITEADEAMPDRVPGTARTTKSTILETGASAVQNFSPTKQICAHLNAFHVYVQDPSRCVESNHYCSHITEDFRQCLIYDSPDPNARLIGVEYMVTPRIFSTLPAKEQKLWHTHVFEVKSGMLIMPAPSVVPETVWSAAEKAEMEEVIPLYGKTYHFWQVDRGDKVPMGEPQLMGSFRSEDDVKKAHPGGLKGLLAERDRRFGVDFELKREQRKDIEEPALDDTSADQW